MKLMQNPKRILSCLLPMLFLAFFSCEKDEPIEPNTEPEIPEKPQVDLTTQKVNSFILGNMYDAYLWDDKLPEKSSFDIRYESDPFKLLDTLIYKELDLWTYLSDNAEESLGQIDGDGKTFGYSIKVWRYTEKSDSLFAIVKFVYPESPAEKAGLKRGDILMKINDANITLENYMQLFYGDNLTLTLGKKTEGNSLELLDTKKSMQSIKMVLNPLVAQRVIETNGHKVGYLCYTDYQLNSHEKLATCLQGFKGAGITDMVLDLRYNLGGYAVTSTYLSSMLAPAAKVDAKELFLKEIWNDRYMNIWKEEDVDTYFDSEVPVKLDLPRLYVLTSENTASASESTIIGLQAHMDVIQIGTNTHGKYCGVLLVRPWIDNKGTLDKDIDNWMLTFTYCRFANKNGFTDFKDGLTPQHEVKEDLFDAVPLGDPTDPLLAKALSLITGKQTLKSKSSTTNLQYRLLPELDPKWNRNGMITIQNSSLNIK